jgi:hypothetical protein
MRESVQVLGARQLGEFFDEYFSDYDGAVALRPIPA